MLPARRQATRWCSREPGPVVPTPEADAGGRTGRTRDRSRAPGAPRLGTDPRVAPVPGAPACRASPSRAGRRPACRRALGLPGPSACLERRSPCPVRTLLLHHRGIRGRESAAPRPGSRQLSPRPPGRARARARCQQDPHAGSRDRAAHRTRPGDAETPVGAARLAAPVSAGSGRLRLVVRPGVDQEPGSVSAVAGTPPSVASPFAEARSRSLHSCSRSATIAWSVFAPIASTRCRRTSRQNSSASA